MEQSSQHWYYLLTSPARQAMSSVIFPLYGFHSVSQTIFYYRAATAEN